MLKKPNVLFIMCDQFRADAIAALGNQVIKTPNLDRLVRRSVTFDNAYSPCPVCVPARYNIRTGCDPYHTGYYQNAGAPTLIAGQPLAMEERCGKYLARTMKKQGYRTFGIGKSHTMPWDEDLGYDVQLHSEELWGPEQKKQDAYAKFIYEEHPEFDFIEQLHGERTEMYYMPQMSPLPAELTVEAWAADQAIEQIQRNTEQPYFGFVSFIGPHPPFAPPIPFNRMYNPDIIPNPVRGDKETDLLDEQLPWMNYLIWADDINDSHARTLKARYYGEISYIDECIGRILDVVEARDDADNTLICFFSDHGDHLGDHHAWQKESFFEQSARIPFLVGWPNRLPENVRRSELVSLTDLFAIATSAASCTETRDGVDLLGILEGQATPRTYLFGFYETPGTPHFKMMVRDLEWKYIYMANGGREQLFNVTEDPNELRQMLMERPDVAERLRQTAIDEVGRHPELAPAMDGSQLRRFEAVARPYVRIHQFDASKGISDFIISK